ncbi:antiviral reverse transcriptase Drt3b [Parapedobacter tibetensis]|uniref:antiviral reverse transcriptase Drt3b n=1 Tax=Parapedobacter tibetensis TaxID=2972951 RepID=UPI00214DCBE1|nr:antiviral reverse transcriptase Drt3b [Parapedobacter tibetensis]
MRYKKSIGYKDARVVLSDILPYEVPPFFSNRKFYDFIVQFNIHIENNKLKIKKGLSDEIRNIIILLFGLDFRNSNFVRTDSNEKYDYFKIPNKHNQTIPFDFKISHKDNDYRRLFVIHPFSQLEIIDFYKKHNSTMLYYTSRSKFSLRKPHRIASLRFFKNTLKSQKAKAEEFIELDKKEYRSLKTYFSYEKYSNIYKYYESYDFQRAEKKFNFLLKFDISRCFDSIYTHSIIWATINKKASKDNLNCKATFGHDFDTLMQRHNYNETNGIVIGPEYSRIFAEIILQKVDHNVENTLDKRDKKNNLDYEIARYVDDYFIYYNDQDVKELIISTFKKELQEYNLYFNESKTKEYSKPIITEISIAKEEIKKLLNNSIIFKFNENKPEGIRYYLAKDIITNYKRILKSTQTSYKDLQNYFLASIYRNLTKLFKEISKEQNALIKIYKDLRTAPSSEDLNLRFAEVSSDLKKKHKSLVNKIMEIIELSFFIYTVLPRVSYSIKLCQVLITIISFIKNAEKTVNMLKMNGVIIKDSNILLTFDFDTKHDIFKRIYDGIATILGKKVINEYSEIETLYLLPVIENLGKEYSVSNDILNKHFLLDQPEKSTNYFTITFLLTFLKGDSTYKSLIEILQGKILYRLKHFNPKETEHIFLLFETLTNPYFGYNKNNLNEFKTKVLDSIRFFANNISSADKNNFISSISNFKKMYFFDWRNPNFGKELNTKRGHEVY